MENEKFKDYFKFAAELSKLDDDDPQKEALVGVLYEMQDEYIQYIKDVNHLNSDNAPISEPTMEDNIKNALGVMKNAMEAIISDDQTPKDQISQLISAWNMISQLAYIKAKEIDQQQS